MHICNRNAILINVSFVLEITPMTFNKMNRKVLYYFLFQVALIATSSYNRMMQPNYEQQLYEWLWEMMLTLRLHTADLPMPVMQLTRQLPNEEELEGMCSMPRA